MAFNAPKKNNADFLDILQYNSVAGRMHKVVYDHATRMKEKVDITNDGPEFAFGFCCMEVGWINYTKQGPDYRMVPLGNEWPERPDDKDDKGTLLFKDGFRVKLFGPMIDGAREWSSTAMCVNNSVEELYMKFENAPEAATGKIPVVRLTKTMAIPGKGKAPTTYAPCFAIVGWTERPAEFGPRTVPAPKPQTNGAGVVSSNPKPMPPATTYARVEEPAMADDDLNDVIPF